MTKFCVTLFFIMVMCICGTARASPDTGCLTGAALHMTDFLQTRQIAKNPQKYSEVNVILGEHPSIGKVNNYFLITGLALYYMCENNIGGKWLKYGWIGVETLAVGNNFSVGIKAEW